MSKNIFHPQECLENTTQEDIRPSDGLLFASMTINLYDDEGAYDNLTYGEISDTKKFDQLLELDEFKKCNILQIEETILKLKSNIFYGSKSYDGNEIKLLPSKRKDKKKKFLGNYVSEEDAFKFMNKINDEIKQGNYSGLVLYISAHGSFGEDGKYIDFSDKQYAEDGKTVIRNRASLKELLEEVGMKNEKFKKIPKLILNDNCYGSNRNYAEVQSCRTSQNEGGLNKSTSRNSGNRPQGIIAEEELLNTIVFNASTEQSSSYGRSLLDGLLIILVFDLNRY